MRRVKVSGFLLALVMAAQAAAWTASVTPHNETQPIEYIPLERADRAHRICVAIPHTRDSYWLAIEHGLRLEAERLGQQITVQNAGGYTELDEQIRQVEACTSNGAEALVLSAISSQGNVEQVRRLRSQGIPVVDLTNGIDTAVDARILVSWYEMGHMACQHAEGRVAWLPGPKGPAWAVAADQGCQDALSAHTARIVTTGWGNTDPDTQEALLQEALEHTPDTIIGNGPAIEVAARIAPGTRLVSYYYNREIHDLLLAGRIEAAITDHMVLQGRIAIDMAVRLLEGVYEGPEHLQPVPALITRESVQDANLGTTLVE